VKAWKALPRFEGRSAFSTWLHRLAVNVVLDARRTETRRAEDPLPDTETVGRTVSTPDLAVDLEREIRRLPATARMAFVLHDVEGYKHREIAEMTGTPEGTWRARLHEARRLLRERLAD
jgi:RNA polymerase sigma-70 factor (ECF subfamily)